MFPLPYDCSQSRTGKKGSLLWHDTLLCKFISSMYLDRTNK